MQQLATTSHTRVLGASRTKRRPALAAARFVLALSAALSAFCPIVSAQGGDVSSSTGLGGALPVKVVAGRLVVACDLSTPANRIPANLYLEFEGRHGLQLHNRAAAALRAESPDGTPRAITLHFPDFTLTVPRRELGDEDDFEAFTKYHSASMGENSLVGSIGMEVLDDWKVTFDLAAGRVVLAPLGQPGIDGATPPNAARVEDDGTVVAPLTVLNGMVWMPVRWQDGRPGGLQLGSAVYDTRVDLRAARAMGRPAGDVGPVRLGGIDLHQYVALRPEPIVEVHPDGVVGITGLNLLEHFRVEVDRGMREVRWKETRPAQFPAADLEFFRARAAEDPRLVAAFLTAHGAADTNGADLQGAESKGADLKGANLKGANLKRANLKRANLKREGRLAHEAARLLLDYRLQDGAPEAEVTDAVSWVARTVAKDLCTTRMLDLMKEMADAGEDEVVIAAGELGVASGRDDRYPNAVHEVHGRLGRTLFDRAEREGAPADPAFRHLLSAAFGLPEDGRINLDLGRFYEHQGRYRRAYSRFIQAVIRPDSGPEALVALQRVQALALAEEPAAERDPAEEGDGRFSVDTIERMIAGKVRNFGAASRFVPSPEHPARRTVLCEFFTNGHFGNETDGGAIGGALGLEGLLSHFDPAQVVCLTHHIPVPQPDALCAEISRERAALCKIERPTLLLIDGQKGSPGAGKWRDAEEIYNRARSVILARMALRGDHEMHVRATLEGGAVSGVAEVIGPDEGGLAVHVVLAEARVLYPGSSGIIVHRNVVRGSLLYDDRGVPFLPENSVAEVEFERTLDSLSIEQAAHLDALEAEGLGSVPRISLQIDPREVRVIAYLCDTTTGVVLAAAQCTPTLGGAPTTEGTPTIDGDDAPESGSGSRPVPRRGERR